MAHMSILFDGFEDLTRQIEKSGGNVKEAVDEALTATQKYIQAQVQSASNKYKSKQKGNYVTGAMYDAIIRKPEISWSGEVAEVHTGFSTNEGETQEGFMHSIFIMYGTKVYGTPRIKKDQKLFNAIKGAKTQKEVAKIQEEIMRKYIKMGGD